MKTMRTTLILATALTLAACSGGENLDNQSGGSAAVEPTPSNLTDDPQNMVVPLEAPGNQAAPVPLPTASPVALTTIPQGFQGRWGVNAGDCDPSTGADKGKLTITGNTLSFFESRGNAKTITRTQADQIAFDLPMSGEGMTWSEPTTLTLLDNGKTLVRVVKSPADRATTDRYSRCPA
ncbi:hypothetical protein AVM11_09100 [Sphingomonas melonis TY]|jgi:hypothetical protein|uniref:Lipocalin-like domain-containing protein n=3 Tax=cellular organisms TaxID=131567 RepID=A0A2A2M488_9BILA|nr:hypothetical protein BJP26_00275 [Sphingomonas melonis TY]ATI55599.1 hypothetical protein CP552_07815 [Sphingomonas melonis]KZB94147.1 hypothetical protein AVM11_09100 [Sphingomonas melonis TY]MBI0532343.1 hypothetical protein [Sphingomonas sp. TX0522]PAV93232.1 hypothetical protein WR25_25292 [Diploscapter pachys]